MVRDIYSRRGLMKTKVTFVRYTIAIKNTRIEGKVDFMIVVRPKKRAS